MERNIEDEVRRIEAYIREEEGKQQAEPEEEIYHVYDVPGGIVILREGEIPGAQGKVIDSIPAEAEPDTQPIQSEDTQKPLLGDKDSERIAYVIMSFSILMVLSIILLQIYFLMNPPTVTVTLIPKSQQITLTGTLQLGRLLNPITVSQSQTTQATGRGHQDAKQAIGTVTFYNGQFSQVIVPAGTILTGSDGIQIATDQDAVIPPESQTIPPTLGQATVPAHAILPDTKGNIATGDINQRCCAASILAQNTQPFHGGQDERNFQTVTQADIDGVAATLKTTLSESMQGAMFGQVKSGEALISPTCTPTVTADHHPGEEAVQVKVTMSETCSAVAYNSQELEKKATDLETIQARQTVGTGYSLLGNVNVTVNQATITGSHPTIAFSCSGVWVYALSNAAQEHIKNLIKGKTKQEALHMLQSLPGIEQVATQWDENTKLPKDIRYIHLVIIAGI